MNSPSYCRAYVSGSGPALVVMHGWDSSAAVLLPFTVFLAHSFTVHSIDLPGFGASPVPPKGSNTKDYASAIAAYIRTNAPDGAHVLGHSFGAQVALELALSEPSLVKDLILIAAPVAPVERTIMQRLTHLRIRLLRRAFHLVKNVSISIGSACLVWHSNRYGSADYRRATSPRMREILVSILRDRTQIYARLNEINHRVLLLWGADDVATPAYMALRLRDRLKHSTVTILDGKDHFPFSGLGADLCAHKILNFLSHLDPTK